MSATTASTKYRVDGHVGSWCVREGRDVVFGPFPHEDEAIAAMNRQVAKDGEIEAKRRSENEAAAKRQAELAQFELEERLEGVGIPQQYRGVRLGEIEARSGADGESLAAVRRFVNTDRIFGMWLVLCGRPAFAAQLACSAAIEIVLGGASARYVDLIQVLHIRNDDHQFQGLVHAPVLVMDLSALFAPANDADRFAYAALEALCAPEIARFIRARAEAGQATILVAGCNSGTDLLRHMGGAWASLEGRLSAVVQL